MMLDCRFEEYFLPDTPATTFRDETLRNLLVRLKYDYLRAGVLLALDSLTTRSVQRARSVCQSYLNRTTESPSLVPGSSKGYGIS